MARGFEIETALGAPFSLAKRRPWSVFAWGLLTLAPMLVVVSMMMPAFLALAAAGSDIEDPAAFSQIMMMNLGVHLGQILQLLTSTLVAAAVVRAVIAGPRARPNGPFFLGFGMAELMLAVSALAVGVVVYGLLFVLALIGVGVGFAAWPLGAPWNWLIVVGYGAVVLGVTIWLALRLSLVVVASSARRTLELEVAWRATKGQVLKILLLLFLCWLAQIAVMLVFGAVVMALAFGLSLLVPLGGLSGDVAWTSLKPWQIALLAVPGVLVLLIGGWVIGLTRAVFVGALASVWSQLTAKPIAKAADADPSDAVVSPEL